MAARYIFINLGIIHSHSTFSQWLTNAMDVCSDVKSQIRRYATDVTVNVLTMTCTSSMAVGTWIEFDSQQNRH